MHQKQRDYKQNNQYQILWGKFINYLIIATSFFLFLFAPANAEVIDSSCATYNSPDQPILTTTGRYRKALAEYPAGYYGEKVPLDTPSYYWQQGSWFKMPLGYQNPHPSDKALPFAINKDEYEQLLIKRSEHVGFDPETKTYNPDLMTKKSFGSKRFAFWMPSKRYVERDRRNSVAMRPCEAGRKPATQDEYVVTFDILWAFHEGSEHSGATRRFRNAFDDLKKTGRVRGQGLIRDDHSRNGPISGKRRFAIYEDDGDLVVMLRGWPFMGSKAPINPICDGWVWERSSNLALYINIAGDQCQLGNEQRWQKPVRTAIELAKQWRTEGQGE